PHPAAHLSSLHDALPIWNGNYELSNLNPGPYTVSAEMEGFQRHVHQGVSLETAQTLRVDIAMQIGQVTESVTIIGEAPLIETDRSEEHTSELQSRENLVC